MDGFHMSTKAFGLTFAGLVMGFIGGNNVNVFLLRRFTSQQIFLAALAMQVFVGAIFFLGLRAHLIDLRGTLILFFIFLSCIGFTYPNGAAIGLAPFARDAGRASALLGFLQTGIGAFISMGIGLLGVQSVIALMGGTAAAALAILLVGRRFVGELVVNEERETVVAH